MTRCASSWPRLATIDSFEHDVETLVRALAKVENDGETEGAKLEATKNVEAEKLEF